MKALILLFACLLAILVWQLVKHYPAFYKRKRFKSLLRLLVLLLAIALMLYGLNYYFSESSFFGLLIAIIILLFGLPVTIYFGRDLLSGLQLKADGKLAIGKLIKTDNMEAKVLNTGLFRVRLSDSSGRQFSMPYSSLPLDAALNASSTESTTRVDNLTLINLEVPATDEKRLRQKIHYTLLNCPWVKLNVMPTIAIETVENGDLRITIIAGLLANKYKSKFEILVKEKILAH